MEYDFLTPVQCLLLVVTGLSYCMMFHEGKIIPFFKYSILLLESLTININRDDGDKEQGVKANTVESKSTNQQKLYYKFLTKLYG